MTSRSSGWLPGCERPTIFLTSTRGGYDSPPAVCCLVHEKARDLVTFNYHESELGRRQNLSANVMEAERDVREWNPARRTGVTIVPEQSAA